MSYYSDYGNAERWMDAQLIELDKLSALRRCKGYMPRRDGSCMDCGNSAKAHEPRNSPLRVNEERDRNG